MFTIQSLVRNCCFILFMIILFLRDWNIFKQKANKNTQIADNHELGDNFFSLSMNFLPTKLKNMFASQIFIIFRYVLCVLIGIVLFIFVTLWLH